MQDEEVASPTETTCSAPKMPSQEACSLEKTSKVGEGESSPVESTASTAKDLREYDASGVLVTMPRLNGAFLGRISGNDPSEDTPGG